MGRRLTSALAVAAVFGVAAAAAFDALRGGEPQAAGPPPGPPSCREGQLGLELAAPDDRPVIVLRHVRGPPCIAPDYEVVVEVSGGEVLVQEGEPGGLYAPGVQWERTFRFQPRCDQRGPFSAVVRVGPYSDRSEIPALPCLRTGAESSGFHRECIRSWNAGGNRVRRDRVVSARSDIATLFRSSGDIEVERCSLHLVSSQTSRWLLAFRFADRWWSMERHGVGDPPTAIDFYDAVPVGVRPDGTIALRSG